MNFYNKNNRKVIVGRPVTTSCFVRLGSDDEKNDQKEDSEDQMDLSEKIIIMYRFGFVMKEQVDYICYRILILIKELFGVGKMSLDFIRDLLGREMCLVGVNRLQPFFFTYLQEIGNLYLIDTVLKGPFLYERDSNMELTENCFRNFVRKKMENGKQVFALSPRSGGGRDEVRNNLFLHNSGFIAGGSIGGEVLKQLQTYENWGELLEEAFTIFEFVP